MTIPPQNVHSDLCLHELIGAQANRTPDAIAVVFESHQLTYRQLNCRANQLARELQIQGAGPDKLVALCVERSLDMIVGLLGILKAGAAYVPLDPLLPAERLSYMLEDSQAVLVVTQSQLLSRLPAAQSLDLAKFQWDGPDAPPVSGVTPQNLAYVIYTSGSTGKPKGVEIEHRQLVNYVAGILERMEFPAGASFATVSTIAADLGNTMVFPALCMGGCLHVISSERAMDAGALAAYFTQHRIDCLKIVPSHFAAMLNGPNPERLMPRQRLILGGEASRCDWIAELQKLAPDCIIFNHYGPTETTVGVLTYRVGQTPPTTPSGNLPLGKPLLNSEVFILDENRQRVTEGELYIGGAGVGRGYHHRPELTAERFVEVAGKRMYRTGDQARLLPDGNIEFLGRIDQQVKIHGHRIELGEIEAALAAQEGIRQAAVIVREDRRGDKRLVAYVVPSNHHVPTAHELRERLRVRLPEFMLPAAFVTLPALPLTPNGKLDRRALPAAEQTARPVVAPQSELERKLAALWQEALGMDSVGLTDNFFDLGGDSVRLMQVHGKLRGVVQQDVPLTKLFQYPTIQTLAGYLSQPAKPSSAALNARERAARQIAARVVRTQLQKS